MTRDEAATIMTNALKGFHGRFKRMYGQLCVRVDENTFLSTGGNKILAEISEDSYELCDINSGELGEIFTRRSDINAILFGCSADTVAVSEKADALPVTLEDLAMLTGPELRVIPDASSASILAALRDSSVCLIKGTGTIAVGTNCRKAVAGAQIVEKACEAEIHGEMLGGTVPIEKALAEEIRKDFVSDYINRNEEDVTADGNWQKYFTEQPAPFTDEEQRAYLDTIDNVALGSDAFFPFSDNIERAYKSGVKYIAEPGGSIRDDAVIDCCDKYGMAMAFTGMRLFHH